MLRDVFLLDKNTKAFLISCLFLSFIAGMSLKVSCRTTINTIDLNGIVKSFIQETAKQDLNDDEKSKKVKNFAENLNKTVNNFAKKHNILLVPKEAVIAGSDDVTTVIVSQLQEALRK